MDHATTTAAVTVATITAAEEVVTVATTTHVVVSVVTEVAGLVVDIVVAFPRQPLLNRELKIIKK